MSEKAKKTASALWSILIIMYYLLLAYLICGAIVWGVSNPRGGIGLIAFVFIVLIFYRAGYLILLGLWDRTATWRESLRVYIIGWLLFRMSGSGFLWTIFVLLTTEQEWDRLECGLDVIERQRL